MLSLKTLCELSENRFSSDLLQMQHCIEDLDVFLKSISSEKDIYWSPKIDGVRVRAVVFKKTIKDKEKFRKIAEIKYFSRNQKEFKNFNIDDDIIELSHQLNQNFNIRYPILIDIEVTGPQNKIFGVMTQLRRKKDVNPDIFKYFVFDFVADKPLEERQRILEKIFNLVKFKKLKRVPFYPFYDFSSEKLSKLVDENHKKGFEGIVLFDKNMKYKFGRISNCCKMKIHKTIELKVIDVKEGSGKYSGMLGSFVVEYKGKKILVSGGRLTISERKKLYENPPIGKIIEVQYQEETPDGYLRKPIFIRFRPDKD